MLKPRIVIVDLDMTLADTLRCFYRVLGEALSIHGYRRPGWNEFVDLFCRDKLDSLMKPSDRRSVWMYFKLNYIPLPGESRLYKGAYDALRKMREWGARIIVATGRGTPCSIVEKELRELGVEGLVDSTYTLHGINEAEIFGKQRIIGRILRDYGADPSEAVVIGDYWMDMLSSMRTGVLGIGVETGCKPRGLLRLAGAKIVVEGLWLAPYLFSA